MDFGAWLTDRDIEFAGQTIRGQGSVLSAEVGSLLSLGEATEIQPLLQIVWSHAEIDSFTDDATGNEMQPGDSASLRVRAGAILRHKLGETWSLDAFAMADHNGRDAGRTFLASGYADNARLSGLAGEFGLGLSGQFDAWTLSGLVSGRASGADEAASTASGRVRASRRF